MATHHSKELARLEGEIAKADKKITGIERDLAKERARLAKAEAAVAAVAERLSTAQGAVERAEAEAAGDYLDGGRLPNFSALHAKAAAAQSELRVASAARDRQAEAVAKLEAEIRPVKAEQADAAFHLAMRRFAASAVETARLHKAFVAALQAFNQTQPAPLDRRDVDLWSPKRTPLIGLPSWVHQSGFTDLVCDEDFA